MQDWHSTCLGRRTLPRDLSAFGIQAFFNFAEGRVIDERRGPAFKLALALHIGFLRMTARLLEAVRIVLPPLSDSSAVAGFFANLTAGQYLPMRRLHNVQIVCDSRCGMTFSQGAGNVGH
jgi:hypothetical protein